MKRLNKTDIHNFVCSLFQRHFLRFLFLFLCDLLTYFLTSLLSLKSITFKTPNKSNYWYLHSYWNARRRYTKSLDFLLHPFCISLSLWNTYIGIFRFTLGLNRTVLSIQLDGLYGSKGPWNLIYNYDEVPGDVLRPPYGISFMFCQKGYFDNKWTHQFWLSQSLHLFTLLSLNAQHAW